MSIANYLVDVGGQQKTFSIDTINITREPASVFDSARISDVLEYLGNATYLQTTTQNLTSSTTYVPVFQRPGIDLSGDFLRVRPAVDLFNFEQLLNFEYALNVISNSKKPFDIRFTIYDLDLNILQTYDPVRYDPSTNPYQPSALDSFTFKGYSVQIPAQAEYGFLEISGAGTLNVAFDYANSQLVNAIDNSDPAGGNPPGSRSSKNIFVVDWFAQPFDTNISGDIQALEADVAQLQVDVAQIDVSLGLLETGYLKTDGSDPMLGALQLADPSFYPDSGFHKGILLDFGATILAESTDADPSFCPAISLYGDQATNANDIYFYSGTTSGNQRTTGYQNASLVMDDDFKVNIPMEANAGLTISGIIDQTGTTGFNVFRAPIIADFGIDMNGNGIGSLAMFGSGADQATNKGYVDTADALRLPLAGGTMTGNIDMGGNQNINNLPNPTQLQQPATKFYVDTALGSKLNTTGGTLTGNLNMGNNQINNLAAPLVSSDAANKSYVDGIIVSGAFLPKAGGTMTGAIDMGSQQITDLGNPTQPTDAANKQYVDSQLLNDLPLTGGTMSGTINMNNNRITNLPNSPLALTDAVNSNFVSSALSPYLPKSGGTMTGSIQMGGNQLTDLPTPVLTTDATTKQYVDNNFVQRNGSSVMNGNLQMGGFNIAGVFGMTAPSTNFLQLGSGLNMNGFVIRGLGNAGLPTDAMSFSAGDARYLSNNQPITLSNALTANAGVNVSGLDLEVINGADFVLTGNLIGLNPLAQVGSVAPNQVLYINSPLQGSVFLYSFSSGTELDNAFIYLSNENNSYLGGTTIIIRNLSGSFAPNLIVRGGNPSSAKPLATIGGSGLSPFTGANYGVFSYVPGSGGGDDKDDWYCLFAGSSPF